MRSADTEGKSLLNDATTDRGERSPSSESALPQNSSTADAILALQRSAGNAAVAALILQRHHGGRHRPADIPAIPLEGLLAMARRGGEAERTGLTRQVSTAIDQRVREAVERGKAARIRQLIANDDVVDNPRLRQRISRLLPDPSTDPAPPREDEAFVPAFSQGDFDTCGAASLLTAMLAFDRASPDKARMNRHLLSVCSLIRRNLGVLSEVARRPTELLVNRIQERAQTLGSAAISSESDYQMLAASLYNIARAQRPPEQRLDRGMLASEIEAIVAQLNTDLNGPTSRRPGVERPLPALNPNFTEFVETSSLATSLQPGDAVQVTWYARGSRGLSPHAVLLGRLPRGLWYYNDQGSSPALRRTAGSLTVLLRRVCSATGSRLLATARLDQIRAAFSDPGVLTAGFEWHDPTIIAAPR